MLAIARALMSKPKCLMLDEPSLGIAPMLVRAIFDQIVANSASTAGPVSIQWDVFRRFVVHPVVIEKVLKSHNAGHPLVTSSDANVHGSGRSRSPNQRQSRGSSRDRTMTLEREFEDHMVQSASAFARIGSVLKAYMITHLKATLQTG